MLMLALIVWQTLGLPEVEDPIPDRIGVGSIMGFAGFGGMLAAVFSVIVQPRNREQLIGIGTFVGCCFGVGFYAVSFLAQLIFSP